MVIVDIVVIVLLAVGVLFVVAGTVGLLRFPDLASRLHAVSKADVLGLGFIATALAIHILATEPGWAAVGVVAKLALIWILALIGTAANAHLMAGSRRRAEAERGTEA
ncbi:MAG: cation:proton antiporter [Microcella sp.]